MKALLDWSQQHFSHLPWRSKHSRYRTLVSEIMLQQTTVSTVLRHFEPFIQRYPNITALASANEEEICVAWKGLGYYQRARNLVKAAQFIVNKNQGNIPHNYHQLKQIPGIGDYTASALIAIGSNKKALCIDANIERVTARLFGLKTPKGPRLTKEIKYKFAAKEIYSNFDLYPPRALNEALMDLGRTICKANNADCAICPLAANCIASLKDPLKFPNTRKKSQKLLQLDLIRCVTKKENHILVYKKPKGYWLSGQYELPTFILRSQDNSLKQYPQWEKDEFKPIATIKSAITKYNITNHIVELSASKAPSMHQCEKLIYKRISSTQNLSSITFKILAKLEQK